MIEERIQQIKTKQTDEFKEIFTKNWTKINFVDKAKVWVKGLNPLCKKVTTTKNDTKCQ